MTSTELLLRLHGCDYPLMLVVLMGQLAQLVAQAQIAVREPYDGQYRTNHGRSRRKKQGFATISTKLPKDSAAPYFRRLPGSMFLQNSGKI